MSTALEVRPPQSASCESQSPNEAAKRRIGRDYLSWSSVSTSQRCPLKFFFQYVAGLEPEFVASSLVFGSAIHTALEHHFLILFEGAPPASLDEWVRFYDEAWAVESGNPVRFGKSESQESLQDLARRMLAAFQASDVSKVDGELLVVEEEFRAPVIPGCPDLLGRIDLVILDTPN